MHPSETFNLRITNRTTSEEVGGADCIDTIQSALSRYTETNVSIDAAIAVWSAIVEIANAGIYPGTIWRHSSLTCSRVSSRTEEGQYWHRWAVVLDALHDKFNFRLT